MPAIIETRDLTRRFGELTAVDRLNLTVAEGEIFGLVGPDGAGKTTTLRMLCGLVDADRGQRARGGARRGARVAGGERPDRLHGAALRPVPGSDRGREHVLLRATCSGSWARSARELTGATAAHDPHGAVPRAAGGQLSGGMKQKLALMCTLLHRPRILFLDEPTNGVDPVSRRDFWAILYQLLKDGITIFMATAYLDEAERCNRVGLMHKGQLIRCDTPEAAARRQTGADSLEGVFIQTIRSAAARRTRREAAR